MSIHSTLVIEVRLGRQFRKIKQFTVSPYLTQRQVLRLVRFVIRKLGYRGIPYRYYITDTDKPITRRVIPCAVN